MIFKRREKATLKDRVRQAIAPRKGFWRGMGYIGKRIRRLVDTPHRIALGFACGAFVSFSPFFGLHFFLAAGCALIVRGNVLAALFGTVVGNPFTFPFIATTSLWIGRWLMDVASDGSNFDAIMEAFGNAFSEIWSSVKGWFGYEETVTQGLARFFEDVFVPYLVGGIVPGLVTAAACYYAIVPVVAGYQRRRRERLAEAQARRRAMLDHELEAYRVQDGEAGDNV